jgi:prevent-host-death family protein
MLTNMVNMTTLLMMPQYVAVAEAKAQLSDLLRQAEAGQEIIVTRNGEPVARLGPVRPRTGGFLRGEVLINDVDWWHADDDLADDFGV